MDPSAAHLRPWRRGAYLALLLSVLVVLVTWVVLAVAALLGRAESHLCPLVCLGVVLAGMALPFAIRRRAGLSRARSTVSRNEDALALLRMGRYEEAADVWNDLCHAARHAPGLHALYVYNLAMASLHQGHLAFAKILMERVRESGWLRAAALRNVEPTVEVGRALVAALSGEVDAARGILEPLEARLSEVRRPMTMLVRAVIDAREGREVVLSDDALRQAEALLMRPHVRALSLLEAFTRARGDAVYRESAGTLPIDARAGELDFLAADWPELRTFMSARGL